MDVEANGWSIGSRVGATDVGERVADVVPVERSPTDAHDAAKTKTTSTTQAQFVANTQNTPGTLKDFVGAKSDAHDTSCNADGSKWVATGKVTNSSKKPAHYRIYVSFLQGDTTVGLSQSDFAPVAPGATHDWSGSVKTSGKDLRCILRVERADA